MRVQILLSCLLVGCAMARPQDAELDPGCRYETKLVDDIKYEEVYDETCVEYYEDICVEKEREVCTFARVNVCEASNGECTETACTDCKLSSRQIQYNQTRDECIPIGFKVCDQKWELQPDGSNLYVDDLDTCEFLKKDECTKVTKTLTRSEPFTQCTSRPCDGCEPIVKCERKQTLTGCKKEKYDDCCEKQTLEDCTPRHRRIAVQVKSPKSVIVCGDSDAEVFIDQR